MKRYSPLLTPAEQPLKTQADVQDRAKNESIWHEGDIVQATITVQGWFRGSGATRDLWRVGEDVFVNSPMAMLDQVMSIQNVTFTQDRNQGTLTTLDVVVPWLLRGTSLWNVGNQNVPPDPTTPEAMQQQPAPAATTPPPETLYPPNMG